MSEDVLERADRLRLWLRDNTSFGAACVVGSLIAEIRELREDVEWAVRRGMPRIRRDNPRSLVVGPSEGPLRWIEFDGTNESLLCAVREARTK